MVSDIEDEYAQYDDFSDLTEEQLSRLEAAASSALASSNLDIPHIQVELDDSTSAADCDNPSAGPSKLTQNENVSPLHQFRSSKILSVTDLVSPAWCEVQFDYGLRQQRHRRLRDRPASFVSEQGKEIFVDNHVAASADKVKKKGKSVHKKLEKEIRPEEIKVNITTEEEHWGLKILNMIDCIDSLLLLGCAREMPVFGLVEGNIVLGIIDEVILTQDNSSSNPERKRALQSPQSTPQKPKRARRSPSQSPITTFMPMRKTPGVATADVANTSSTTSQSLHLLDTKTRRNNSLPQDSDTLSSRLQLMLYHRLLTKLLDTRNPFDFSSFWLQLGLEAAAPFSPNFHTQTLLTPDINCLSDLTELWRLEVSRLNGAQIDPTLQLVYRSQSKYPSRQNPRAHPTSSREEIEIAMAIEASLHDVAPIAPKHEQTLVQSPEAGGTALEEEMKSLAKDPELLWAIEQSLVTHLNDSGIDLNAQTSAQNNQKAPGENKRNKVLQHSDIIGTKEFEVDLQLLDEYLVEIMKWWNGERRPRGVSLEQSGRCFSCEYRIGCEWREQQAKEFEDQMRNRKRLVN